MCKKSILKRAAALVAVAAVMVSCVVSAHAADMKKVIFKLDSLEKLTTYDDADYNLEGTTLSVTKRNDSLVEWSAANMGDPKWTDYTIEFDVEKWIEGQIGFRWSGENINCYTVGVDGASIFMIKWKDGQATVMDKAENAVAGGAPWAGARPNPGSHWKITVVGDVFSVYVDDMNTPKVQTKDSEYKTGVIGMLTKMSVSDSPSAIFKNITVYGYDNGTSGTGSTAQGSPQTDATTDIMQLLLFTIVSFSVCGVCFALRRKAMKNRD